MTSSNQDLLEPSRGAAARPSALCDTLEQTAVGSMQWLVQDPIPFLVLLCLVLITVWLLRWFKGR